MEPQTIQTILFMVFVALTGIVYSLWNYVTKVTPETFELKRAIASAFFGLFLGAIAIYMGLSNGQDISEINWSYMAGLFLTYSGALVYLNQWVDWLWAKVYGKKFLSAIPVR
jgi:hypothetical protein